MGDLPHGHSASWGPSDGLTLLLGLDAFLSSADSKGEWSLVQGLFEPGQDEGLITSFHLPLAELSHMATLTARDAGKYSQAVCPGGKQSGFGASLVHLVLSSPGPSTGPIFLEFLDTAHSVETTKHHSSFLGASLLFPQCKHHSMDILAQVAFATLQIWLSQPDFQIPRAPRAQGQASGRAHVTDSDGCRNSHGLGVWSKLLSSSDPQFLPL